MCPAIVVKRGNQYLRALARRDGNNLTDERHIAYAIYLLTRQGQMMSAEASALRKRLTTRYEKQWEQDLTALWLGASFKLMRQDSEARRIVNRMQFGLSAPTDIYSDAMTRDAFMLYVLARHFAHRLSAIPPARVRRVWQPVFRMARITRCRPGSTLLALNAYVTATNATTAPQLGIAAILRKDKSRGAFHAAGMSSCRGVNFGADAQALRFSSGSQLNAYYVVEESGFDRKPPDQAITQGFEIIREYGGAAAAAPVKMGDTVTVHLKVRSTDGLAHTDVALVDLFPGGFDLVMPPGWLVRANTTLAVTFADPREDRIVFYATVGPRVSTLNYTLRATNVGTYVIPPAYGEAMYDRSVVARSIAGSIRWCSRERLASQPIEPGDG